MKRVTTDKRSTGLWLWAAIVVGKGNKRFTHGNNDKVFTFKLLPRQADAPHHKPRGLVSIKQTLQQRIHPKSFLVFDKWTSTVSAVQQLGYDHAPGINHGAEFRSRATGFHSNDIESEFNRLKRWLRQRYGLLHLGGGKPGIENVDFSEDTVGLPANYAWDDLDLCEYMFYNNVGSLMADVMTAFVHYNGGRASPTIL